MAKPALRTIPCKHGHTSPRSVATGNCLECQRSKPRNLAYQRAYRETHREQMRAANRAWHAANREQRAEYDRLTRLANIDEERARYRARQKANPGYYTMAANRRRSAKLQATPSWVDHDAIQKIYQECAERSALTGVKHHVDHEIPLRGKTVCGLHVHYNLQIIPANDNLRKGSRLLHG